MKWIAPQYIACLALCLMPLPVTGDNGMGAEVEPLPPGGVYRYQDGNGQMVMSNTLPREALQYGYQVLGKDGRVVADVEAAPDEAERARHKERQEAQARAAEQRRQDEELRRLYTGPSDAIRARDRQIDALRLSIDYTRNNIMQVKAQLDEEIAAAARFERSGKPIPDGVEENIARFTRQVNELEAEIEQYEAEIEAARENYAPIIERLKTLAEQEDEG